MCQENLFCQDSNFDRIHDLESALRQAPAILSSEEAEWRVYEETLRLARTDTRPGSILEEGICPLKRVGSVNLCVAFLEDEIFHPRIRKLLSRLAEKDHQHHPLDLFDVDIRRLQC